MEVIQLIVIPLRRNKRMYLPSGGICHKCFGTALTLKAGVCKYCYREYMRENHNNEVWKW